MEGPPPPVVVTAKCQTGRMHGGCKLCPEVAFRLIAGMIAGWIWSAFWEWLFTFFNQNTNLFCTRPSVWTQIWVNFTDLTFASPKHLSNLLSNESRIHSQIWADSKNIWVNFTQFSRILSVPFKLISELVHFWQNEWFWMRVYFFISWWQLFFFVNKECTLTQ